MVLVDAAGAVIVTAVEKPRPMSRTAPRSTVSFIGAAGAVGGAVADERLGHASIFGFAEDTTRAPESLEFVVDGVFVMTGKAAGNPEAAAFMLVGFVLAIGLAVASGLSQVNNKGNVAIIGRDMNRRD